MLRFLLAVFAFTFFAPAAPAQQAGKKYAFLVGCNLYRKPFKDLKFAERDVEEMAKLLKTAGYDEVILLVGLKDQDKDLNRKMIEDAYVRLLGKIKKQDFLLVGLAGHGLQFPSKVNGVKGPDIPYFCPQDAVFDNPETMVSINFLVDRAAKAGPNHSLFLIDACRVRPPEKPDEPETRGVDGMDAAGIKGGTAVFFSCSKGEEAIESRRAGGGHGVFFHYILEGLSGKANQDDDISCLSLAGFVERKLKRELNELIDSKNLGRELAKQTPHMVGSISGFPELVDSAGLRRIKATLPVGGTEPALKKAEEAKFITSRTFPEMKLMRIPAGKFVMGSPKEEQDLITKTYFKGERPKLLDTEPPHEVSLTKDFYLGEHTVTLAQWRVFQKDTGYEAKTGAATNFKQEDDHPAVNVNYDDAKAFCDWLGKKDGRTYQLPTEAQWEYACRAGTKTAYNFGDNLNGKEANCNGNHPHGTEATGPYLERTTKVGSYRPNGFGLYDMHGNVYQWCADWYGNYPTGSVADPYGAASGTSRVLRGGSWYNYARGCRSALRTADAPTLRTEYIGFRISCPIQ